MAAKSQTRDKWEKEEDRQLIDAFKEQYQPHINTNSDTAFYLNWDTITIQDRSQIAMQRRWVTMKTFVKKYHNFNITSGQALQCIFDTETKVFITLLHDSYFEVIRRLQLSENDKINIGYQLSGLQQTNNCILFDQLSEYYFQNIYGSTQQQISCIMNQFPSGMNESDTVPFIEAIWMHQLIERCAKLNITEFPNVGLKAEIAKDVADLYIYTITDPITLESIDNNNSQIIVKTIYKVNRTFDLNCHVKVFYNSHNIGTRAFDIGSITAFTVDTSTFRFDHTRFGDLSVGGILTIIYQVGMEIICKKKYKRKKDDEIFYWQYMPKVSEETHITRELIETNQTPFITDIAVFTDAYDNDIINYIGAKVSLLVGSINESKESDMDVDSDKLEHMYVQLSKGSSIQESTEQKGDNVDNFDNLPALLFINDKKEVIIQVRLPPHLDKWFNGTNKPIYKLVKWIRNIENVKAIAVAAGFSDVIFYGNISNPKMDSNNNSGLKRNNFTFIIGSIVKLNEILFPSFKKSESNNKVKDMLTNLVSVGGLLQIKCSESMKNVFFSVACDQQKEVAYENEDININKTNSNNV